MIGGPFDGADGPVIPANLVVGSVSDEQAYKLAQKVVDSLEAVRTELSRCYSGLVGGTFSEHEIGEMLTLVRKALVRSRKAVGTLAQAPLPLSD